MPKWRRTSWSDCSPNKGALRALGACRPSRALARRRWGLRRCGPWARPLIDYFRPYLRCPANTPDARTPRRSSCGGRESCPSVQAFQEESGSLPTRLVAAFTLSSTQQSPRWSTSTTGICGPGFRPVEVSIIRYYSVLLVSLVSVGPRYSAYKRIYSETAGMDQPRRN